MNLLEMLRGTEKVILIDAVKGAGKPGEVFLLTVDELDMEPPGGLSLHQLNLAQVMALGNSLFPDEMPGEIFIVGVEALNTTPFNLELSEPLQQAIPQAVQIILNQLPER
mgnify:CR=1 FL=1